MACALCQACGTCIRGCRSRLNQSKNNSSSGHHTASAAVFAFYSELHTKPLFFKETLGSRHPIHFFVKSERPQLHVNIFFRSSAGVLFRQKVFDRCSALFRNGLDPFAGVHMLLHDDKTYRFIDITKGENKEDVCLENESR